MPLDCERREARRAAPHHHIERILLAHHVHENLFADQHRVAERVARVEDLRVADHGGRGELG